MAHFLAVMKVSNIRCKSHLRISEFVMKANEYRDICGRTSQLDLKLGSPKCKFTGHALQRQRSCTRTFGSEGKFHCEIFKLCLNCKFSKVNVLLKAVIYDDLLD